MAQDRKTDEEIVRLLDDQERVAALKRDVSTLQRLWSDRFAVNAPTNAVVVGRQAALETFVHRGVINFAQFDRKIEHIQIDQDLAIIMGAETVRPRGDAPMSGQIVQRRFTNIWKKEGETWRLFARHANNVVQPR